MDKKTLFIIILCIFALVSLAGNVFLVFTVVKGQVALQQQQVNRKVLEFRNMFTEKVLLSNKEIDFDTRLQLETSVRALNNSEIFAQWQRFTNSTTKEDATFQAKALLQMLIQKTEN